MRLLLLLVPLVSAQWIPPPGGQQGGGLLSGLFGGGGGGGFGNRGNQGGFGNQGGLVQNIMKGLSADLPQNGGPGKQKEGQALLTDLRGLLGQSPNPQQWERHARRFCTQYPQHPRCRNGNLPQYNDLSQLIGSIGQSVRRLLPMVPRLNIRDPLTGVPSGLAQLLGETMKSVGFITEKIRQDVRNVCKRVNCKERKKEHSDRRNLVRGKLVAFEKTVYGKDTTDDVELRLQRTRQVKQAFIDKAQLGDTVEAADDGVFEKDILLTTEQANFLLNELGKGGATEEIPAPPTGKVKRASLFLEEQPVKKWDINQPVRYTFHESLEEWDKNDVRNALAEITAKVPCIRFQYVARPPTGPHLNYMKIDNPSFCGLSYIGRNDPANPIYLSFQCGNSKGVAIHETMHALGVNHQHLRMDRDQHITVDWSNINPQQYDVFAVADGKLFTSYGVQYDYGSVMHYNAYTGAIDISKPTMVPKVDSQANIRLLGQRDKMSARDIELLKKMYCKPGCTDTNVYCGAWALQNLCHSANNGQWMQGNCKKSCNVC